MKKYVALAALMASLAAPAAAQMAAPMAVPLDREGFRQMALVSDAFEIASSRLALERSRNPRVRAYAEEMIRNHRATSEALNGGAAVYGASGEIVGGTLSGGLLGAGVGALVGGPVGAAVGAGVGAAAGATTSAATAAPNSGAAGGAVGGTLAGAGVGARVGGPVGAAVGAGVGATAGTATAGAAETTGAVSMRTAVPLDARKSAMLQQLAAARGSQFDRLYGQAQRMAHREALALYTAYAQTGRDPAMVNFAQSVIPHLQNHYAQAQRLPGGR
jgi:predicted outer membrane protein